MITAGVQITEKRKKNFILFYYRTSGIPLEMEIIELTIQERNKQNFLRPNHAKHRSQQWLSGFLNKNKKYIFT